MVCGPLCTLRLSRSGTLQAKRRKPGPRPGDPCRPFCALKASPEFPAFQPEPFAAQTNRNLPPVRFAPIRNGTNHLSKRNGTGKAKLLRTRLMATTSDGTSFTSWRLMMTKSSGFAPPASASPTTSLTTIIFSWTKMAGPRPGASGDRTV